MPEINLNPMSPTTKSRPSGWLVAIGGLVILCICALAVIGATILLFPQVRTAIFPEATSTPSPLPTTNSTPTITPLPPVAKVGDQTITISDFQKEVRFQRYTLIQKYYQYQQLYQMMGQVPEIATQMQQLQEQLDPKNAAVIGQAVLDKMIEDILVKQKAAELHIIVSEQEITDGVQAAFGYFPGGTPTPIFPSAPGATSTLSPLQETLVPQGPTQPVSPTQVPTITTISTPYTLDAYQANLRDALDKLSQINYTEADIRAEIQIQILKEKLTAEFAREVKPLEEQVWARHILVSDLDTANQVRNRLLNGESWTTVAAQLSLDSGTRDLGGDVGWFGKGVMIIEFEQMAFTLPIGEISSPIRTTYGYHVIQVLGHEIRPLTPSAYQQQRQNKYDEWLKAAMASTSIQKYSWVNYVPKEPVIP